MKQTYYRKQIAQLELALIAAHDVADEKAVKRIEIEISNYKTQLK